MRIVPSCEVKSRKVFTGLPELIRSENPKLRAIQAFITAWQKAGAHEEVVPLVLSDVRRVLDGTWKR